MEKSSITQGHYSKMEKRVFYNTAYAFLVIYGMTITGCSKDESVYHDIKQNNSVDQAKPVETANKEQEEISNDNSKTELKTDEKSISQASVKSSVKLPEVENKDQTTQKNKSSTNSDVDEKTENKVALAENDKKIIQPVDWEQPVKAVKPVGKKSKLVKREVKILIPDKTFKPEGDNKALRVSYDDIDLLKVINMEPVTVDAQEKMPQWLKDLDGERIRIRGFMYPHYLAEGIEIFALARDNQICCFQKEPRMYDVFNVKLQKGKTTEYIEGRPFDVEGVFHISVEEDEGEMLQLYYLDDAIVVKK